MISDPHLKGVSPWEALEVGCINGCVELSLLWSKALSSFWSPYASAQRRSPLGSAKPRKASKAIKAHALEYPLELLLVQFVRPLATKAVGETTLGEASLGKASKWIASTEALQQQHIE